MTVNTTTAKVSYAGNGSTTAFAVSFYFLQTSHLKVVLRAADGTETVKTLGTDYSVTGAGVAAGGTVTMVVAPPSGQTLVIARNVPQTQLVDYQPNDPFPANTHEMALDQLTMEVQQLQEQINRAIKLSLTNTINSTEFTVDATTRANKVLAFDSAGELSVTQELGTYKGNWASGTVYAQRSIIKDTSNNNIYLCLTAHTSSGSQPISTNTDSAKWALLVDAASAASSATAAASSASAAATSATNASTSATNAATSATNASNSATAASGSASTASTQASNASTSATNAATSATNASNSATAAANSATAAAAAAASGLYRQVLDKTANYTVVAADQGTLFRMNTGSGALTVTLPQISTVSDGFKVSIVKWTGDTNQVTINRTGSDTINGATSATIGSQYSQTTFVADFETNTWFAASSGLGSTNVVVDVFSGNGGTTFTLSGDPGSKNNTWVEISGVYQNKSTYSISGTTLTFSAAPPTGTGNIEVVWTQPLAVGVPSDLTVTTAKIADAAVTGAKLENSGVAAGAYGSNTAIPVLTVDAKGRVIAASTAAASGSLIRAPQVLTSGTSYTTPSGCTAILVELVGGGGGGGGNGAQPYGGGGSGGYARKYFAVTSSTAYTYAIGAGGSAGSSANGGGGGDTTFTVGGTTVTAGGGNGGAGFAGGTAGFGTNGDLNVTGSAGGSCTANNLGGFGGASYFSGGGKNGSGVGPVAPTAGSAGGGGGGASTSHTSGAAGGSGLIIVWEYR